MDIKGKIIQKLDLQSGTSKAGNAWKMQEYILETLDSYPKKVKFDFFGDRADQYPLEVGDVITLSYDIESREFNGRWYTSIRAWRIQQGDTTQAAVAPQPAAAPMPAAAPQAAPQVAPQAAPQAAPAVDPFDASAGDGTSDLPF